MLNCIRQNRRIGHQTRLDYLNSERRGCYDFSKTELERTRYLSDGSKIFQVINVNTGRIISTRYIAPE
jgi:hypothetical protein